MASRTRRQRLRSASTPLTPKQYRVSVPDDLSLIQQVLVRYANAIDELDFDSLATVFTPDARASYGGGPWLEGLDAIVEYISPLATLAASFHFMGNMQIDVDGDRARATTRSLTHLIAADGALHARALRYRDQLDAHAGRLAHQRTSAHGPVDVGGYGDRLHTRVEVSGEGGPTHRRGATTACSSTSSVSSNEPIPLGRATGEAGLIADSLAQAKLADELGYGCWWTVEHHGCGEFSLQLDARAVQRARQPTHDAYSHRALRRARSVHDQPSDPRRRARRFSRHRQRRPARDGMRTIGLRRSAQLSARHRADATATARAVPHVAANVERRGLQLEERSHRDTRDQHRAQAAAASPIRRCGRCASAASPSRWPARWVSARSAPRCSSPSRVWPHSAMCTATVCVRPKPA